MVGTVWAANYVGAAKCKMCHQIQFKSWETTKHAKAFDALKGAEQTNAKCVKCHTTGSADIKGVQCEACHGAGSDYMKMQIMKITENVRCTVMRIRFCCFSVRFGFLLMPSISIQKLEVNAVSAPSALGNKADISAMMKMIPIAGGR